MNQRNSLVSIASIALFTIPVTNHLFADVVHNDDVIIQEHLCVGDECIDGESFSNVVKLKQQNLRIEFEDTSNSASFPSHDWRIKINDSTNGGDNKFAIENDDTGNTPFMIMGNAPNSSLFIANDGDVGFGTNTPAVDVHISTDDTPHVRLEQDGTGFGAQIWDVAGNEANFFIRDATNAGNLPFRLRPGAPSSSLEITASGDVALGVNNNNTATPAEGSLHIKRSGAPSIVLETTGPSPDVMWEIKANATTGRLTFKDLNGTTTPFKFEPTAVENLFRVGVAANDTVDINGNLIVKGDLTVNGNCTEIDGACADYVFADDYELRSLQDVAVFIKEKKHLPNVPSAREMEKNGISIAHITGRLLSKIEELTLYTLQQENTIAGLQILTADLHQRLENIEAR